MQTETLPPGLLHWRHTVRCFIAFGPAPHAGSFLRTSTICPLGSVTLMGLQSPRLEKWARPAGGATREGGFFYLGEGVGVPDSMTIRIAVAITKAK